MKQVTIEEVMSMTTASAQAGRLHKYRHLPMVLSSLIITIALGQSDGFAQTKGPVSQTEDWYEKASKPPDWSVCEFDHPDDGKDGYRLKRIKIEMRRSFVDEELRHERPIALFEIDDGKKLAEFEGALRTIRIHPPKKHPAFFGDAPHGRITFETTKGSFFVCWGLHDFMFNATATSQNNAFWSMGLAALVDRELRRTGNPGFDEELIDRLSGLKLLRQEREQFGRKRE